MNRENGVKPVGTLMLIATSMLGGCVSNIDPNVPEPIRTFVEPNQESDYYLYRPSSYDREYAWPLVIVCHSGFPDSPRRQLRDWTQLSERQGFLVAAPALTSSGSLNPGTRKEVARERADDERIVSVIRHIQAGHSISDDRIFIYGWDKGAYQALYTGLRHPTLFRAIALLRPAFNEDFLPMSDIAVSPDQPVYVNYDVADSIIHRHGKRCVRWLRSHAARVVDDPSGAASREQVERVIAFFEEVVRDSAWMHIDVRPSDKGDPLRRIFILRASPVPTEVRWSFGDGDESRVDKPIHRYRTAGTYRVEVTASFADRPDAGRAMTLTLPQGLTAPAPSGDQVP